MARDGRLAAPMPEMGIIRPIAPKAMPIGSCVAQGPDQYGELGADGRNGRGGQILTAPAHLYKSGLAGFSNPASALPAKSRGVDTTAEIESGVASKDP